MAKMIVVHPERCTGCRVCELACSFRNDGVFNPAYSRIFSFLFVEDAIYMPITCMQCEDAPCAEVCPSKAITREISTGVLQISEAKCFGCKMCMMACPFGVMTFNASKRLAVKCEQCDGEPECVTFCVPKALEYRDVEVGMVAKRRSYAQKIMEAGKEVSVE